MALGFITDLTVRFQKCSILYGWLTYYEIILPNGSITFLNADNNIFYTEGNICRIIAIPVIESTFEGDYIRALNDLPKR